MSPPGDEQTMIGMALRERALRREPVSGYQPVIRLQQEADELPVEHTKLLDHNTNNNNNAERTLIIDVRNSSLDLPVIATIPALPDPDGIRIKEVVPRWVHFALATSFSCCVVLFVLLMLVLSR
jgi:hypothetical protein